MPAHVKEVKSSAGSVQLVCLDSEPGKFAFFGWQNVLVSVWLAAGTGAAVERLGNATRPYEKFHPRGVSNIHLVKGGAGMPTAEARAGFVGLMERYSAWFACIAVSLLGRGFWASALQGAVTGMRMLAPRSFEMRIHDDIEGVLEWLPDEHLRRTGVFLDKDELYAVMNQAFLEAAGEPILIPGSSPKRS